MLAGLFASTMTTAHLPSKATKSSSINKARALLRGVGVAREDSDDELGDEDLPWEWVYSAEPDTFDQVGHSEINGKKREIIGARTGDFDVRIGDCVFIKGDGLQGEAYVGMACEFEDSDQGTEDDMSVNVMWFSTEFEIKNKEKKRMDFLPNELYINPSYNLCPLRSINGRAKILSPKVFNEQYPNGVLKKSRDYGKVFVCRRGCNPRTANYTPELDWDTIYKGRHTDIFAIGELVRQGTKATRTKAQKHAATENRGNRVRPKRRRRETSVDSDDSGDRDFIREGTVETIPEEDEEEAEDDFDVNDNNFSRKTKAPRTPSKRRTNFTFSTPTQKNLLTPTKNLLTTPTRRTPTSARKFTTPTNRKITIKKPLLFTPLNTRTLPNLSSPYAAARHHLHVSTLPASLPCREAEFNEVYTQLSAAITEGTGSCIYISGTPGTGKTATVREVITQLRHLVALEELDDFTFVEINGMKVADPHQSYSLLWEAIKGDRVSPSQALGLLESEFSTPSPRRVPCVVLMDELDQLVTKGQGVMYNFFNWPGGKYSRLIVLAVANTMDLPERTLSNKISSRLGLTRITFPGYTYDQLMTIIKSRLESVQGDIVDADAVQFASRKVAAVSGDARRALDICRRAVEMVEYAPFISSENEKGRRLSGKVAMMREDEDGSGGGGIKAGGRVTIATIRQAILEATSSPVQVFLKTCSLSSKVFLVALLVRCRRSGVGESVLRDVMDEAARIVKIQEIGVEELGGEARVGGIESAVKGLVEAGVVGLEKKGSGGGRVRFLINEEEIKIALKDDKAIGAVVGRAG
ncbi:P-loop containing nucleoside triphosphate hydrolase protein [Morchella snyderi]|nr:P-loop containing nucleoside triphosphate hydrolase protein [Morchella snyderi]